ncbi:MAG: tetratricopeptide repeat protein [Candidatus Cloacimonadota bacterium]|nr:tetratricopeptide repeat protein [Candidatus Cloacimonadota bacterium]
MKTIKIKRISILLILVLLISFSQLLSQTNETEAEKYFNLGEDYYEQGLIDKAIECYQKVVEINPDDAYAYYNMGYAYGDKGNYNKAIECFQKAVEINPDFAVAYNSMGMAYGVKGNYDKAIECYQKVVEINPDDAKAHFNLGDQYFNKTLYDEAIKEYEIALNYTQDDLDKAVLYERLGHLYHHPKENYDKSIEYFKKALNIQPEDEIIYVNMGTVYADKGDYSKAIEYYQKAIEIDPDDASAYYNMGNAYDKMGNYDKAIAFYQKAIEINPDDAYAYNNMGLVYYYKGWKTSAADYLYQAGLIYLKQNNRQRVLRQIDVMKDLVPDSPLIHLLTEKLYSQDIEPTPQDEDITYSGSGFIIHNDGFIVTNYHIIEGMENIDIYFPIKDKQYKAKVFIKDINNDIALLKIDDPRFTKEVTNIPFGLGNSSDIKVGQEVYTIGFPMGDILGKSAKLSTGVVNSVMGILDDPTLIQISNPIQPGNSGGALFNSNGDVIGIVIASLNAKYFYENTDIIPQNVNFAIKVDYLKNLISMLPDGEEILNRKSQISNLPLETQFEKIKPFVVNIKAY